MGTVGDISAEENLDAFVAFQVIYSDWCSPGSKFYYIWQWQDYVKISQHHRYFGEIKVQPLHNKQFANAEECTLCYGWYTLWLWIGLVEKHSLERKTRVYYPRSVRTLLHLKREREKRFRIRQEKDSISPQQNFQ